MGQDTSRTRLAIVDRLIERGLIRPRPNRGVKQKATLYDWSKIHPLLTPAVQN